MNAKSHGLAPFDLAKNQESLQKIRAADEEIHAASWRQMAYALAMFHRRFHDNGRMRALSHMDFTSCCNFPLFTGFS